MAAAKGTKNATRTTSILSSGATAHTRTPSEILELGKTIVKEMGLDDDTDTLGKTFNSVEFVGYSPDNPYALEKHIPIFICKNPKKPGWLQEDWPRLKHWR